MRARPSPRRARIRLVLAAAAAFAVLAAGGALVVGSVTEDEPGRPADASDPPPSASPGAPGEKRPTPASGRPIPLVDAKERDPSGVSIGWPHTSLGAVSAAVRHWQELDLLDDDLARQQLKAISAPGSGAIQRGVSEVRRTRESAGLPPSGGPPPGVSVETEVTAVRLRSLDAVGDVVEVWMIWDRYAQVKDEAADRAPLRNEMSSVIYTWSGGDWKRTSAKRWTDLGTHPRAYFPNSPYAYADGWREVSSHG
jgi:hypothetical protein